MGSKVLVAYASSYGSTQEIAKVIAEVLHNNGLVVDLQTIKKVQSLQGYSAVVLGSPLYMFHWHRDALKFLSRYQSTLETSLPVAVFAGGPTSNGDEEEWKEIHRQFASELGKFPWFKPISVLLVGGRFDPTKLHFPFSLIPALHQLPATDFRNWSEIRTWADGLARQFHCVKLDH